MSTQPQTKVAPPLLVDEPGHEALLLGNEAIVRGALEAGVGFASGYPGTPSSEITDAFARLSASRGIVFEYSVNEKIALEVAFAACLAGTRAIVAMKHLGLTYAGDPLTTIPYVGTVGGLVIVSAGDPSCRTSPNEQDQRHLADMLHIPTLDPSTPQEALEMTRFAFELSERSKLPVLLRPTTRVCHTRARVTFGPLREAKVDGFARDPQRFIPTPGNARVLRHEIEGRLAAAREVVDHAGFHGREGHARLAVLGTGVPAATCRDVIREDGLGAELSLLHLGVVHPLPETWLVEQLQTVDTLLVVEELSPYVEDAVRALCSLHELPVRVLGKRTGHLAVEGEYRPEDVRAAIHALLGKPAEVASEREPFDEPPKRPPILCAACPHRSAFFSAKSVFGDEALYFNDIGCYTLGAAPPLNAGDALLCMGAGFSLAAGVARTTGKKTVGFCGDSTFFHSGMPALLDAIKENVDMVAVVMDNDVTAMTGFQESPTVAVKAGKVERSVDIAGVARALGAQHVTRVDPNDLAATVEAFRQAQSHEGLSVVITERPCPVFLVRERGDKTGPITDGRLGATGFDVDPDACRMCGRAACGHRCGQDVDVGFERVMARARSLEVADGEPRPEVAACAEACPLYLCIQGYVGHVAAGNYAEAYELITDGLVLPESVCRVCDRPCEDVCVRAATDAPIAINDLKRFVVDWAQRQPEPPRTFVPGQDNGLSVSIVGAGPAGLAAAAELRMRGYGVTLYDRGPEPGGLLRTGIPAYRLPREALRRDVGRILELGVDFRGGTSLGRDVTVGELLDEDHAVLLAIGAHAPASLELPGDGPAPVDALRFLADGDAACSGSVVVIGGGNSAVDAARVALRRGASRVTIACLEDRPQMPAIRSEIAEAEAEGIEILCRTRATGREPKTLEVARVSAGDPADPSTYEVVEGTAHRLAADMVIAAIGQRPDPELLAACGVRTKDSAVGVDRATGLTSRPRLFAAGDVGPDERSVATAIASGRRAAWGIDRALRGSEVADRRPPPPRPAPPERRRELLRVDVQPRRGPAHLDPTVRRAGFDEVVGVLDEAAAVAEASRCMMCGLCGNCRSCVDLFGCPAFHVRDGAIGIDPQLCVACGVCADFCPNGAIHPTFEEEGIT